jgi:hypothetical protein
MAVRPSTYTEAARQYAFHVLIIIYTTSQYSLDEKGHKIKFEARVQLCFCQGLGLFAHVGSRLLLPGM